MDTYNSLYWQFKLDMLIKALVLIGAINWGLYIYDYNIVDIVTDNINKGLNTNYAYDKIIYLLISILALYLVFKRDTWLPFLGKTVVPGEMIALRKPDKFDIKIKIKVKPNSKVIYWAASGKNKNQNVDEAYNTYANSGVILSDDNGDAELLIMEGEGYNTPLSYIDRHIHYRVFYSHGMLGSIKTVYY